VIPAHKSGVAHVKGITTCTSFSCLLSNPILPVHSTVISFGVKHPSYPSSPQLPSVLLLPPHPIGTGLSHSSNSVVLPPLQLFLLPLLCHIELKDSTQCMALPVPVPVGLGPADWWSWLGIVIRSNMVKGTELTHFVQVCLFKQCVGAHAVACVFFHSGRARQTFTRMA
jgi:hypothetical protein